MYLQVQSPSLFVITFCQMFGRRHTPSARPSLLMFLIDRPIARISSYVVLYRVPRSGSFTLASRWQSRTLISSKYSGTRGPWQQRCDSLHCHEEWWGSVPPSVIFLSPCDYDLFVKGTTARNPVQHKRWTYPCYRMINTEHLTKIDALMVYDAFQRFGKRW